MSSLPNCRTGALDDFVTKTGIAEIALEQKAFLSVRFDGAARLVRVTTLGGEMTNGDIGALAREQHGHRSSYARIAAGDERNLAFELARGAIFFRLKARSRIELRLDPGLLLMLLRKRRHRLRLRWISRCLGFSFTSLLILGSSFSTANQ
jgi:hypothetical protein